MAGRIFFLFTFAFSFLFSALPVHAQDFPVTIWLGKDVKWRIDRSVTFIKSRKNETGDLSQEEFELYAFYMNGCIYGIIIELGKEDKVPSLAEAEKICGSNFEAKHLSR